MLYRARSIVVVHSQRHSEVVVGGTRHGERPFETRVSAPSRLVSKLVRILVTMLGMLVECPARR